MATPVGPDPLRLRPHGLEFDELRALNEYLERLLKDDEASLAFFQDDQSGGYDHRVDPAKGPKPNDFSKASTATCLAYLRDVHRLDDVGDKDKRASLRTRIIAGEDDGSWDSAELGADNVFTVSFLLDAIHALGAKDGLKNKEKAKIDEKIAKLKADLDTQGGGLALKTEDAPEFAKTAFLTHKAVSALELWKEFDSDLVEKVRSWTWHHLYEESALIASNSPDADFLELAYSVLCASLASPLDRMTPRERRLLQYAVDQFFSGQREDGTWPRSRPLFLYPGLGFAYCFDYELLTHLLSARQLGRFVIPYLGCLRKAAWALDSRRVPLEVSADIAPADQKRAFGWSSEHHGKEHEAESWSTAAVLHFCFRLKQMTAEAVRRDLFEYVDVTYTGWELNKPEARDFDTKLLDSTIKFKAPAEGGPAPTASFKDRFDAAFLKPLAAERDVVRDGGSFGEDTAISAILYGPPGTAKTETAKMVAQALGWPLLSLDPSHLTRRGLDNVHAETDAIFGRLRLCDQLVVLLDEFDELVREREGAGDLTSRFLTTAMLPKIAALSSRRRIVYLVATNHLEQFDDAIARPGRFDVIIPVLPPTLEDKLRHEKFEALAEARGLLDEPDAAEFDQVVGALTYGETKALAARLTGAEKEAVIAAVRWAKEGATIYQEVGDKPPRSSNGDEKDGDEDKAGEVEDGADAEKTKSAQRENWEARIDSQANKIRGVTP